MVRYGDTMDSLEYSLRVAGRKSTRTTAWATCEREGSASWEAREPRETSSGWRTSTALETFLSNLIIYGAFVLVAKDFECFGDLKVLCKR